MSAIRNISIGQQTYIIEVSGEPLTDENVAKCVEVAKDHIKTQVELAEYTPITSTGVDPDITDGEVIQLIRKVRAAQMCVMKASKETGLKIMSSKAAA